MEANSFIWGLSGGLQLFIDSIQESAYKTSTRDTNYIRASTGNVEIYSIKDLPTDQIKCTWTTVDYDRERVYEYITGQDVVFGFGAKHRASFVKIKATFNDTPSTVQHGVLDIVYTGIIRGFFSGCEDATVCEYNGGSIVTDQDAMNNAAYKLSKQYDTIHFEQNNIIFPQPGNYLMFLRAKDVTHITNDVMMSVYDNTLKKDITVVNITLKAACGFYGMYFTISQEQVGHDISFIVYKTTASTNSIYCDVMGYVALP